MNKIKSEKIFLIVLLTITVFGIIYSQKNIFNKQIFPENNEEFISLIKTTFPETSFDNVEKSKVSFSPDGPLCNANGKCYGRITYVGGATTSITPEGLSKCIKDAIDFCKTKADPEEEEKYVEKCLSQKKIDYCDWKGKDCVFESSPTKFGECYLDTLRYTDNNGKQCVAILDQYGNIQNYVCVGMSNSTPNSIQCTATRDTYAEWFCKNKAETREENIVDANIL